MSKPTLIKRGDWAREADQWVGKFEGGDVGTGVTVLFFSSDRIGAGPPLHVHPYDELFILRQGRARFTVGDDVIDYGGHPDQRQESPVPTAIEEVARHQQKSVLSAMPQPKVDGQDDDAECPEFVTIEQHET